MFLTLRWVPSGELVNETITQCHGHFQNKMATVAQEIVKHKSLPGARFFPNANMLSFAHKTPWSRFKIWGLLSELSVTRAAWSPNGGQSGVSRTGAPQSVIHCPVSHFQEPIIPV